MEKSEKEGVGGYLNLNVLTFPYVRQRALRFDEPVLWDRLQFAGVSVAQL